MHGRRGNRSAKSVPASLSLIAYNSNPEVVLSLPDLYHLAAESEDEQRTTAAIRPFLKTVESSAEELEKYFDSGDRKALSTARARARPTGQADSGGSGEGKLLSPEGRRRCVVRVRQQLGASERRACRVLGQPRTTQRRARKVASDEGALRGDIVRLASRFGRYGYRRVTDMLRIEGWGVNHKRVERIWRQEGLKVPQRQPKRGRLWLNDGSCIRLKPLYRGHVWSYDFVASRTHDGRALKLLTVLDEHTRECLAIVVARKIRAHDVLEVLADLFVRHAPLEYLRSDNGPEFTAKLVRRWLGRVGAETLFIEPGSPWENGYNESFNGKLRDELLNGEIFYSVAAAIPCLSSNQHIRFRPPTISSRPSWYYSTPWDCVSTVYRY